MCVLLESLLESQITFPPRTVPATLKPVLIRDVHMTSWETAKSQRREDIVAAARALMRRSGEDGFSMRTLAEAAGVSIATPYNLFGSKQAILLAVLSADLADYEAALAQLHADKIEVLFQAVSIMTATLRADPEFYRNMLSAVSRDGGPEFRFMVSGPRYILWKRLLGEATQAGLLQGDVDPDALAITITQHLFANVQAWSQGLLGLDEMDARMRFGLALSLTAIATLKSRGQLLARQRDAEALMQHMWRSVLARRLADGPLDPETRAILADQLVHVENLTFEESA